jgi:hypothetical protein
MARRKSKIQPAVLTMTFASSESGASTEFIDLSQVASIMNRRFYRQGINWAVAGFKFSSLKGGTVNVSKLPNTWVMSNAWEKAFRAWQRQQREALDDGTQESVRAKFNDFKIFADGDHLSSGVANNLMPVAIDVGAVASVALPGEWEPSQIVIPNYQAPGVNYEPYLTAVGDDVGGIGGSISLIKAYQSSRSVPQSPDPAIPPGILSNENFLSMMFDVGDNNEDIMDNVVGKNDELPYVQNEYPGGPVQLVGLEWHDFAQIYNTSATTNVGITTMKGGNFPCGLIRIDWTPDEAANLVMQIDLIPGNHRGYLCEPMTEM